MRADLPTGTVTFLFTDIEGSTRLLNELGPEAYADALAEHRRILRAAFAAHGGVEVDTQGDAFFVAFPTATGAVDAAREAQRALSSGPVRVRMGIHTGTPLKAAEGYVGPDVHRAARVAAAGHGGQVLLTAPTAALVASDNVRDLGLHKLKDLAEPEHIYQLGYERFPPLKTISNSNLPHPASSFVGRAREVADVAALLTNGSRLVTLTGPGGTGKTRLAIASAAEVVPSFADGVFWVGLATLRDPELVPAEIARTLGARDGPSEHIGEREMLLVLDNLEQVVDSAPGLARLLEACPKLRLLTTSRERLRIRGETEYPVPPLADEDAIVLFCDRAQLQPDETIADLCRRLDDLPLAVELAAARTNALSPTEILQRLATRLDLLKGGRDADARQETLRTTIQWSYDLLDGNEQQLFARLAVFHGGWTIQAAEQVADADLDVVASLVDKSLIRRRSERYVMLETIRQYAAERLAASDEAESLTSRHAEHFFALAQQAQPHLDKGEKVWVERLASNHDNLRAAFDWFLATGATHAALRMVSALFDFYMIRGHFAEALSRAEKALAADDQPTPARAGALHAAAVFADITGQVALAKRRAEEALVLSTQLGDARGAALARHSLGVAAAQERDWAAARDIWQECVEAFTRLGDDHLALMARRGVAWASEELGDLQRYRELTEENLEHARRVGDRRIEARSLGALAMVALEEDRLDDGLARLRASYEIDRDLANPMFVAVDLGRFAALAARQGRPAEAAQLVGAADRLWTDLGVVPESWMTDERTRAVEIIRNELSEADYAQAVRRGATLEPDEAVELGLAADTEVAQPRSPSGT